MGNEVVRLKHEADAVISVYVPIAVGIIFRGNAADDEIAGRVMVESADDVQKRCFSASRRTEYGNEFIGAEFERYAFECVHDGARGFIILFDVFQL